ncbi:unnamed protein product [Cunninghamella blakesleeana]
MDLIKKNNRESLAILAAAISISFGAYFLFKGEKKGLKSIPEPPNKWPLIGHLLSTGKSLGDTVNNWHDKYGPIVSFKIGAKNFISISDPFLAHQVFSTNGAVTSDRSYNVYFTEYYSCGGKGIVFSNANKRWKKARAAVLNVLSPRKVEEFNDIIVREADRLLETLLKDTEKLGSVDPSDYLNVTTVNIILQTSYGMDPISMDDDIYKEMKKTVSDSIQLSTTASDITTLLPFLSFLNTFSKKKNVYKKFIEEVHHPFYQRLIDGALKKEKDNFTKKLIALKNEYGLDDESIVVICSDIMGAGTDTTVNSVRWMMAILIQYPEIQEKLRYEIDGFIKKHNRLPEISDREELPYLIAFGKECLRFKPLTAMGVPHVANDDVIVQDYLIPKGSMLVTNMTALHRNPKIYDDPNTFNPDRFLNNTSTFSSSANGNVNDRDQYNFGWGRRICPGIHLAEVQLFYEYSRLFAYSIIAPALDEHGNEIPVDIEHGVDGGLSLIPPSFKIRILKRSDPVIKRHEIE